MHVDEAADPGEEWQSDVHAASEEELRGYWEDAKELLAFAKRQGHPEDHPVRRSAQRQVDEAFAEWRAATPPKAVHARMGWAEEALRRAQRAQAKAEQELEELDRQYELDRGQRAQTPHEARERTRARAQKLAELSREAAEEYHGDTDGDESNLLRGTFRTLDAQVGPALEEVLARMDKGSEQYNILHQTLQSVTTLHAALGAATGGERRRLLRYGGRRRADGGPRGRCIGGRGQQRGGQRGHGHHWRQSTEVAGTQEGR